VRRQGDRILLLDSGRLLLELPYPAARELARALLTQAVRVDEVAHAQEVVADQALLLRSGAPFALTQVSGLLHEASRLARYDRSLRRALPGVVPVAKVGVPSIRLHPENNRGQESER